MGVGLRGGGGVATGEGDRGEVLIIGIVVFDGDVSCWTRRGWNLKAILPMVNIHLAREGGGGGGI